MNKYTVFYSFLCILFSILLYFSRGWASLGVEPLTRRRDRLALTFLLHPCKNQRLTLTLAVHPRVAFVGCRWLRR